MIIHHLHPKTNQYYLNLTFSKFGPVLQVKMIHPTSAIIDMMYYHDAIQAQFYMNDCELDGHAISVTLH